MRELAGVNIAVVLALLVSGARAQAQLPQIDPAACWRFEIASERGPRPPTALISPIAVLTTAPASGASQFVVRRLDLDGRWLDEGNRSALSTWHRTPASDSLQVSFSAGFARYVFVLAAQREADGALTDTLTGRADFWSDDGPAVYPKGTAYAVRVSCPVGGRQR